MSICTSGVGNNSLTQGFVGPTVLVGRRGCCIHDGGVTLTSTGGAEPSSMRAGPWTFLLVSSRYAYRVDFWLCAAPISPNYELTLKSGAVVTGIVPHWLWSFISL
jgi:hypothetical protein